MCSLECWYSEWDAFEASMHVVWNQSSQIQRSLQLPQVIGSMIAAKCTRNRCLLDLQAHIPRWEESSVTEQRHGNNSLSRQAPGGSRDVRLILMSSQYCRRLRCLPDLPKKHVNCDLQRTSNRTQVELSGWESWSARWIAAAGQKSFILFELYLWIIPHLSKPSGSICFSKLSARISNKPTVKVLEF